MEEATSPKGKALLRGQNNRYKPLNYTMSRGIYIRFGTIIEHKLFFIALQEYFMFPEISGVFDSQSFV